MLPQNVNFSLNAHYWYSIPGTHHANSHSELPSQSESKRCKKNETLWYLLLECCKVDWSTCRHIRLLVFFFFWFSRGFSAWHTFRVPFLDCHSVPPFPWATSVFSVIALQFESFALYCIASVAAVARAHCKWFPRRATVSWHYSSTRQRISGWKHEHTQDTVKLTVVAGECCVNSLRIYHQIVTNIPRVQRATDHQR